ncbi:MAG: PH domain-containing protein [Lewinellaceae bacterium]|nr:PH domain-containing protein [Lewinellaceae bacterium]
MIFENQQIPVPDLPQVEVVSFQSLAPAALKERYWGNGLLFSIAFLLLLSTLPPVFSAWWWLWILIILATGFGLGYFLRWLILKQYEVEGYALRQRDIIHQHGYWWRSQTTVPYARVQHVEITQGPIAKQFGLSTIRIYTAGGSSSDLNISGIELDEARRIESFIVHKVEVDDAS